MAGMFDFLTNAFTGKPAEQGAQATNQYIQQVATPQVQGAYAPLSNLAASYGPATDMYMQGLGLKGPGGNAAATGAFQAGPGYQWQLGQGIQAATAGANTGGRGISGNTLAGITKYGEGLANQSYGDWLNRIGAFAPLQANVTGQAAQGLGGFYGNLINPVMQGNQGVAQAQQGGSTNFWNALMGGGNIAASLAKPAPSTNFNFANLPSSQAANFPSSSSVY